MKMTHGLFTLYGVLGFLGVCAAVTRDSSIEQIMEKSFQRGGLKQQISKELDKDSPNWAAVQQKSKELVQCCSILGQQTPPKGDKASWKKLTDTLAGDVKQLESLVAKKDQGGLKTCIEKINRSCKTCHDAHRE